MKPGILFFSDSRESLPIAWKLASEGIWVDYYIHDASYRTNFTGMLPKIGMAELFPALKRCDTVVFDITLPNHKKPHDLALLRKFGCSVNSPDVFGPISDKLKKTHKVIGGTAALSHIEMDRQAGIILARKLGFDIPPYQVFKSLQEGAKFLQGPGKGKQWYFKPFDNQDLDLTCGDTFPGELADMLAHVLPTRFGKDNVEFMLQEAVDDGIEMSNEFWWDGEKFLHPNRTLEAKKLMDGNLGPATGSQSNIVWLADRGGVVFDLMDKPALKSVLRGHRGPIDANTILTKDGKVWFLEWTPRFGYSALYLFLTMIKKGQLSSYFLNDFNAVLDDEYVASQLVTIYPYPGVDKKSLTKMAQDNLIGGEPWDFETMWWQDVKYENRALRCCGVDGMIGVMTAKAPKIDDAIDKLYEKIGRLKISGNTQYRTKADMNETLTKRFNKLSAWGIYAK